MTPALRRLAALERERHAIASELHGTIGGTLTAVALDLAILERQVGASSPASLARLRVAREALNDALDVKRRLVEALRPSLLEHVGIVASLEARLAARGVEARLAPSLDDLMPTESLFVYRVVDALLGPPAPRAVAAGLERTAIAIELVGLDRLPEAAHDWLAVWDAPPARITATACALRLPRLVEAPDAPSLDQAVR